MSKESNRDGENGFIPIRRGLFDHIKMGLMKGRDIPAYVAIHFFADYETGVAYNVSAPFLANFLHETPDKIRRSLRQLEKGGYIKRFKQRGGDPGYDIVIDKYLVKKCISTSAQKSNSINEIAWTVTKDCTLTVNREHIACTSGAYRLSPIKDIKILRLKEIKKDRGKTPRPSTSFIPPTPEQIKEYAATKGITNVDLDWFFQYFTEANWIKKNSEPVVNWKLTLCTWSQRNKGYQDSSQTPIFEPTIPTEEQIAIALGKKGKA